MRVLKWSGVIIAIIALLVGVAVGVYFYTIQDTYTADDLAAAYEEGTTAGAEFRQKLVDMVAELEARIIALEEEAPLKELEDQYGALMDLIGDQIAETGQSLEEVITSKKTMLETLYASLSDVIAAYEKEIDALRDKIEEIAGLIEELEKLGEDYAEEIAGYVLLRDKLNLDVETYESIKKGLEDQRAELVELLEILDGARS